VSGIDPEGFPAHPYRARVPDRRMTGAIALLVFTRLHLIPHVGHGTS